MNEQKARRGFRTTDLGTIIGEATILDMKKISFSDGVEKKTGYSFTVIDDEGDITHPEFYGDIEEAWLYQKVLDSGEGKVRMMLESLSEPGENFEYWQQNMNLVAEDFPMMSKRYNAITKVERSSLSERQ